MSNNISFTGYDARPLKGLYTRDGGFGKSFYNMVEQTAQILNKEGVDVYMQTSDKILKNDFSNKKPETYGFWPWVQDHVVFLKDNVIKMYKYLSGSPSDPINNDEHIKGKNYFESKYKEFEDCIVIQTRNNIPGGAYYFVKDQNDKDIVLTGHRTLYQYGNYNAHQFFDGYKICTTHQPDYHIDLSVRPLNNQRVLVHDSQMLKEETEKALRNTTKLYEENNTPDLKNVMKNLKRLLIDIKKADRQYQTTKQYRQLQKDLQNQNLKVIKVPGIVIKSDFDIPKGKVANPYDDVHYRLNFMNAIVHERPDKSLVYLTAKSFLDEKLGITPEIAEKIDFSFEKMFRRSLNGIIAPEDIHFVGDKNITDTMKHNLGGLHCLFAEIPQY